MFRQQCFSNSLLRALRSLARILVQGPRFLFSVSEENIDEDRFTRGDFFFRDRHK